MSTSTFYFQLKICNFRVTKICAAKLFMSVYLIVAFMLTVKTKNYVLFVSVTQLISAHIFTDLCMTCRSFTVGAPRFVKSPGSTAPSSPARASSLSSLSLLKGMRIQ